MTKPRPLRHPGLARLVPLAALVLLIVAIAALGQLAPTVTERRVTLALVQMVTVVGLYVFVGNSGVLHFAPSAFMAIGAYTSALLTMSGPAKSTFLPDLPQWLAAMSYGPATGVLAGAAMAGLVALVAGAPLMRLSGISAGIATLALMVIVYIGFGNWDSVTGGQKSLMGLPGGITIWVAAGAACLAVAVAFAFQEGRAALMLRATREDSVAAASVGIRITRLRIGAFALSGAIMGAGGALYAHLLGALRIESFYLSLTFLVLTMLIVGGQRSLAGAVVGTAVISAIAELLRLWEKGLSLGGRDLSLPAGLGDVALALLMLLILIFRPGGIMNGREFGWPGRRRERT